MLETRLQGTSGSRRLNSRCCEVGSAGVREHSGVEGSGLYAGRIATHTEPLQTNEPNAL